MTTEHDCDEDNYDTRGDCDGPVQVWTSQVFRWNLQPTEDVYLCRSHADQAKAKGEIHPDPWLPVKPKNPPAGRSGVTAPVVVPHGMYRWHVLSDQWSVNQEVVAARVTTTDAGALILADLQGTICAVFPAGIWSGVIRQAGR